MYGIDWDGPISEDSSETMQVPEIPCPISDNHLQDRRENIDPLGNCLSHDWRIFIWRQFSSSKKEQETTWVAMSKHETWAMQL